MEICNAHNLNSPLPTRKPFGIRVSLRVGDTFSRLLGRDWARMHWYATFEERDDALRDMSSEHRFSRRGDRPTLRFEPVEQAGEISA